MIARDQQRPGYSGKVVAPEHARRGEDHGRRPGQQVIHECANQPDRPALRPAGEVVACGALLDTFEHLLEIAEGGRLRKARLIEIDLIAILKCAHQLHAIERTQLQAFTGSAGVKAGDQLRQR